MPPAAHPCSSFFRNSDISFSNSLRRYSARGLSTASGVSLSSVFSGVLPVMFHCISRVTCRAISDAIIAGRFIDFTLPSSALNHGDCPQYALYQSSSAFIISADRGVSIFSTCSTAFSGNIFLITCLINAIIFENIFAPSLLPAPLPYAFKRITYRVYAVVIRVRVSADHFALRGSVIFVMREFAGCFRASFRVDHNRF